MRITLRVSLRVVAIVVATAGSPWAGSVLAAQTLRAAGAGERCAGERVTAIAPRAVHRELITRAGRIGRALTRHLERLQPVTDTGVIRRYLLVRVGERCDEQARAESERILRAQPFISDAVIRAVPTGPGEVRLEVETIDEFQLRAEYWGTTGLPAGVEGGTMNLLGRGESLSGLVEYGYGGHVGAAVSFTDYQAFGRPLELLASAAERPLAHAATLSLRRPFLTNFQRSSWLVGANYDRRYITFRSPEIRDLSLDFARRRWEAGRVMRVGSPTSGVNLGVAVTGEESWPLGTVVIRSHGPTPAPGPLLLARYPSFSALRAGVAVGMRRVHFTTVRGFDAITAPQDIAKGTQAFVLLLQGVAPTARREADQLALFNVMMATGTPRSMTQMVWQSETRFPHGDGAGGGGSDRRPQTVGSGRLAWYGQTGTAHTTIVGVEGSGGWRARLPLQLTFRGDDAGLLGWRTTEGGGSQRVIARVEDRWRLHVPVRRADFAVALLAQAGRLWAGDAPYTTSTPWQAGVGVALLAAVPAGSKQTIRLEIGRAVGPGAPRGREIRISWTDRTRSFWREPGDVWLARETSYVSQIF